MNAEQPRDLLQRLKIVLPLLTERERQVLSLRFGLQDGYARTSAEIGKQFNKSSSVISRIINEGLRKLRSPEHQNTPVDRDVVNSFFTEDIQVVDLVEAEKELTPFLIAHLKTHKEDILKIQPPVFEHLIAEFFAEWGYCDVRLVGTDKSTSADIFAMKKTLPDSTELRYFIETKRWRDKVGIGVINSVLGAITGERDTFGWNLGMIVTASGFTDSKRYSNLQFKGIQLKDEDKILKWALLGLWGDYSLNKNRIEIQSAEMEHDVCF